MELQENGKTLLDAPSTKPSRSGFRDRYRYFILILASLCLTSVSSNIYTLNFTVVCMTPKNGSTSSNGPTVNFTQSDKSMLNYAVGVGSIIATFPLNWLYTHYGARFVFLFAGVASTVSTLIIPWVASIGIWWIHAARFLQGIAYAANFAGVGIVCSIWAPLKENAIFLAVLTSYTPISSLITNPVAGILCETLGWPSVYYAHAAACAILFILWFLWYSDEPQNNKNVSEKELEEIHKDKSLAHIKMDSFVPYWEICKNPIVLTVWLNSLAGLGTLVFLYMYGPTYFANVLKFGIAKTGILGSLTVFLSIIVRLVCGYISDKCQSLSERLKMIVFNSASLVPSAILFFLLGYVPDDNPWLGYWIMAAINCLLVSNCAGFYKCATLVSRQYSHFVVSNIQFIKCITLFAAPALVSLFVTNDSSREQWKHVFYALGALCIIANTLFCFLATDKPAKFTEITSKKYNEVAQEDKSII